MPVKGLGKNPDETPKPEPGLTSSVKLATADQSCGMAYRQFLDGSGDPIRLFERDGRLFVGDLGLSQWHQVMSMTSRDDDVLLCGYPKSGLHWLWEIVTMLKAGSTQLTANRMESSGFLMLATQARLDDLPCPRVLTTHHRFHDIPTDFILKRRKMVCILREPKDICVSYYHMICSLKRVEYGGTLEGFVPLFLDGYVPLGSWYGWVLSFEKGLTEHPELSVHVMHYEQLKANPVKEIKRLAQYLGCPEALAEGVAEQTQFSSMKRFKESLPNPYAQSYKNDEDMIFREGQSEQWKKYFTPQQAEQFDTQLGERLGRPSAKANL